MPDRLTYTSNFGRPPPSRRLRYCVHVVSTSEMELINIEEQQHEEHLKTPKASMSIEKHDLGSHTAGKIT